MNIYIYIYVYRGQKGIITLFFLNLYSLKKLKKEGNTNTRPQRLDFKIT